MFNSHVFFINVEDVITELLHKLRSTGLPPKQKRFPSKTALENKEDNWLMLTMRLKQNPICLLQLLP